MSRSFLYHIFSRFCMFFLCFTRPIYQVSVYRTIGPLVFITLRNQFAENAYKSYHVYKGIVVLHTNNKISGIR